MWEIIGWIGSGIVVISMLQQRITRLRLVNLIGCLVSVAYSVAIQAWPLAGLNAVLSLIQIYHLIKLWRTRHDPASYHAVHANPDDEIVAHLLVRHGDDIARFFPHFTGAASATDAFIVFAGDTVAGLTLLTRRGPVAELAVDYVIAAYRDMTPGEFVFRRSPILREAGIEVVVSPAGGPDYYRHLGFTERDGRYELELAR